MCHALRILMCIALLPVVWGSGLLKAQTTLPDSIVVVGTITLHGNEKTKEHIVLRELAFKPGDTLSINRLRQLKINGLKQVFNLRLFTSVDIELQKPDSLHRVNIAIYLKERWYLFAVPIVEIADRNFNQWWSEGAKLSRLNYGIRFTAFNLRGRNETMRINIQAGFTRKFSVDYYFPYINKKLTIGTALNFTYSDNREVWPVTQNNKLQFFRDNDKVLYRRIKSSIAFIYRKKIYSAQTLEFEYNGLQIADTVASRAVNPDFFLNGNTSQLSLYANYKFTYDRRDSRYYALNGLWAAAEIGNYFFFTPSPPVFNIYLNTQYSKKISGRHYAVAEAYGKFSLPGRQPYNLYKAFGYGYFVRGFEYYVTDGQHFALGKINYLYNIVKQRYIYIPTSKLKKFRNIPFAVFAKAFYDAGYVHDNYAGVGNTYANTYLAGLGLGIDVVSYYDRVLKFEYSFNNKGQRGLFLHYNMLF